MLSSSFTNNEDDTALQKIHRLKAPCMASLNSVFYKQSWSIMKHEIYEACWKFFIHRRMFGAIRCTSITLIPKVLNASYVSQFRPTSYNNVLYKIVSKTLTVRLQEVLPKIKNEAKTRFIPGNKQNLENGVGA